MSGDRPSRREFLTQAAVAGVATMGTGLLASAAEPAARAQSPTVLEWWDWWTPVGSPSMGRWFDWVKATFEKQNPGVTVKYQYLPFGDPFIQKLQAAAAAGNPPDVFHASALWASDLWQRGALYKLNDLIASTPATHDDQFFPAANAVDRLGGAIFGVPMEGPDSEIILINVDMVAKKLGWPAATPQDLWTWPGRVKTYDDLRRMAEALTVRSGNTIKVAGLDVAGYGGGLGNTDFYGAMLLSNGVSLVKPDRSGVNLNTPQAHEVTQYLIDLIYKYKVSSPTALSPQFTPEHELQAGHAAMVFDASSAPQYLHDVNPTFRFMMMPPPMGPSAKRRATMSWSNMVCIPKKPKNLQLSWKFATFISSLSTQLKRLEITERYAPMPRFFQTPQWKGWETKIPALQDVAYAANIGGLYATTVHGQELFDKLGPILTSISLRHISVDAGLAQAQKAGDSVLAGI